MNGCWLSHHVRVRKVIVSVSTRCAETGDGEDRPVRAVWVSVSLESVTPGQGVRAHFTDGETEATQGQKGQPGRAWDEAPLPHCADRTSSPTPSPTLACDGSQVIPTGGRIKDEVWARVPMGKSTACHGYEMWWAARDEGQHLRPRRPPSPEPILGLRTEALTGTARRTGLGRLRLDSDGTSSQATLAQHSDRQHSPCSSLRTVCPLPRAGS